MYGAIFMSVTLGVLLLGMTGLILLFESRYKRRYAVSYRSHRIDVVVGADRLSLFVDGRAEDELAGENVTLCTLRTKIDGAAIEAHIERRPTRLGIEVTADGKPLHRHAA